MDKKQRPQDKWNEKNEYITKGFKMYRQLANEYAETCKRLGVSQSGQIVKMMREFIEQNEE